MHDWFHRRFLITEPEVLAVHARATPVRRALLASDSHRRISLRQNGNACWQIVETRISGSWQQLRCRLQRRQCLELWPTALFPPLEMQRYCCHLPETEAWVDTFQNTLEGLHIATFRFASARDAFRWKPPATLGPEITMDVRFRDESLMHNPLSIQEMPVDVDRQKSNVVIGVLPYLRTSGKVEVVAVQTRKKALTIFPKGQPEAHLRAREVACMEALEEAGVEGAISGHPVLMPYKDVAPQHWILFPLEVQTIHSEWKEKGIRNRRLIHLQDALHQPSCMRLLPALRYLHLSLNS